MPELPEHPVVVLRCRYSNSGHLRDQLSQLVDSLDGP
jgi:hypothetical protein